MQNSIERLVEVLEETGRYQILRRLDLPEFFTPPDDLQKRVVLIVDTETTGLNPTSDKIIELGMVAIEYSPLTSRLYRVVGTYSGFEDPGFPLSDEVKDLTGITDEMLTGQAFDDDAVQHLLEQSSLVVAHNASFDRKFLEERYPAFSKSPWACSMCQVDWKSEGLSSKTLDYLLFKCCTLFIDAHRALNDTFGLAALLAGNLPRSRTPVFEQLLERARRVTVRIWAVGAPYDVKDKLKARGYFWCDGSANRQKAWYKDVFEDDYKEELDFLAELYPGQDTHTVVIQRIDAFSRFSSRE